MAVGTGAVGDSGFVGWRLAAGAVADTGPTGSDLRRTVQVIALDQKGEPAVGWILQGAMPIGYELDPMDSSRSEVLTESITFAITGLERTTEI